jgi:outer membrane protein OmpA-like peptidoglycan-associated protein
MQTPAFVGVLRFRRGVYFGCSWICHVSRNHPTSSHGPAILHSRFSPAAMHRSIAVVLAFLVLSTTELFAQSPLLPSIFTNRRMGFVGDASAVGWNPALMGLRTKTDILVGMQHDSAWKATDGYGIFVKSGSIGLGYVTSFDSLRPSQVYAGYGLAIGHSKSILVGASAMFQTFDKGSLPDKLRFQISGMYAPIEHGWLSIGASNMHRAARDQIVGSVGMAGSPLPWLGVHAALDVASKDGMFKGNNDLQVGLTAAPWPSLVVSGMYNPGQKLFRVGVEYQPGYFGIGEVIASPKDGPISGVVTIHLTDDDSNFDLPHYIATYGTTRDGQFDAGCRDGAYMWLDARSEDTPSQLESKMAMASGDYKGLRNTLQELSPDPQNLFAVIGKKYYGIEPPERTEKAEANNPSLVRLQPNYVVAVDSLASTPAAGTALFRVMDQSGRNVPALTIKDIRLVDTSFEVSQFSQVASQQRTSVDFVVLMDCSGSMSAEIAAVRANVENFTRSLANRNIDYRIGAILYGERIYNIQQPTAEIGEFLWFYAKASPVGRDEVTSTAIMAAANDITYRPDAAHIAVLITDDCSFQDNADYSEPDCIERLWKSGVRLYGIVNTKNHNAGFATRLTLGKDYEITDPFNAILDDISGNITTTYRIQYRKKSPVAAPVAIVSIVRGNVRSENGWKLSARLEIIADGSRRAIVTNSIDGQYEFEAKKGSSLAISVSADDHFAGSALIMVPQSKSRDTIVHEFILKQLKTVVKGNIRDEHGRPVAGIVRVENAQTLELLREVPTEPGGSFQFEIPEQITYKLTPRVKESIPVPVDIDMRGIKKGSAMAQDLTVIPILVAVERGMTFKLEKLFFDSGKWELRPESAEELEQLVRFLTEYQSVRVEIGAHTDNVGMHESNQLLSQRRAQSVVDHLMSHGIDEARLSAVGYAETVPVADNATPEGKQMNRRVEFKIIK